jgi:hypothetical protein
MPYTSERSRPVCLLIVCAFPEQADVLFAPEGDHRVDARRSRRRQVRRHRGDERQQCGGTGHGGGICGAEALGGERRHVLRMPLRSGGFVN